MPFAVLGFFFGKYAIILTDGSTERMKNFQYIFAILIAFMPLSAFADYTVTGVVNDEQGLPQSYDNVFNVSRSFAMTAVVAQVPNN